MSNNGEDPFKARPKTSDATDAAAQHEVDQQHADLVERFRAHFAARYDVNSPTNPKGPLPAEMVQIELSRNAEDSRNIEKRQFYRPIWLAWHVISFDHLGGTWVGSETHAGGNLQEALQEGTSLIKLSRPQSRILDALADFAQIPHQKGRHEIPIPPRFIHYYDELPERQQKHKQEYMAQQAVELERARQHFNLGNRYPKK